MVPGAGGSWSRRRGERDGRAMKARDTIGSEASRRSADPSSSKAEPTLEEMLADPIIRLMMARDRVRSADVQALMADVRQRRSGFRDCRNEAF